MVSGMSDVPGERSITTVGRILGMRSGRNGGLSELQREVIFPGFERRKLASMVLQISGSERKRRIFGCGFRGGGLMPSSLGELFAVFASSASCSWVGASEGHFPAVSCDSKCDTDGGPSFMLVGCMSVALLVA